MLFLCPEGFDCLQKQSCNFKEIYSNLIQYEQNKNMKIHFFNKSFSSRAEFHRTRLYHLRLGLHWPRWLGHGAEIGVANDAIMATHLVVAQDV